MKKSDWGIVALLAGGAYLVKQYMDNQAATDTSNQVDSGTDIFSTVTQEATNLVATLTGNKEIDFVNQMTPIAAQIQAAYGIDPLITMTQSALESNWGVSGLTVKANNLFGFTGDSWAAQGKSVVWMNTDEYSPKDASQIQYWSTPGDIVSTSPHPGGGTDLVVKRPFRAYPTWYDSVADWAQLLQGSRYATALSYAKAGDLDNFAQAVWAAGYATDPSYPSEIIARGSEVQSALDEANA